MQYTYIGPDGSNYTEELRKVEVHGILLHATPDGRISTILQQGLKTNMEPVKSLVRHNVIFCSVPSESPSTDDLFRWYDDWSIVVIDTEFIKDQEWFEDIFAADEMKTRGKINNHVMTFQEIPTIAIKKIIKV